MELRLLTLYPDQMNIYADRGNIVFLQRRCQWRGIGFSHAAAGPGERIDPGAHDLFYIGGGQDRDQRMVAADMVESKREALAAAVGDGAVVLAVCGGYQLLGHSYQLGEERLPGLGLADLETVRKPGKRLIGNVAIETDLGGEARLLAGFENHGGRTYLGAERRAAGPRRQGLRQQRRGRPRGGPPRQPGRHLPPRPPPPQERLARRPPHRPRAGAPLRQLLRSSSRLTTASSWPRSSAPARPLCGAERRVRSGMESDDAILARKPDQRAAPARRSAAARPNAASAPANDPACACRARKDRRHDRRHALRRPHRRAPPESRWTRRRRQRHDRRQPHDGAPPGPAREPAATSKSAARPSKAARATTSSTATAATTSCAATAATTGSTAASATTGSKAAGNDRLSGGFGADTIDGQAGNDYVRGDATIDHIFDTGGGFDTLSFATGVTPGFTAERQPDRRPRLPGTGGERGVSSNLGEGGIDATTANRPSAAATTKSSAASSSG